jgi:hypothetical protein
MRLAGATESELVGSGLGVLESGEYRVGVSRRVLVGGAWVAVGEVLSEAVQVEVREGIRLLQIPVNQRVVSGGEARFRVGVYHPSGGLTYAWTRTRAGVADWTRITTEPELRLNPVGAADFGTYRVRVSAPGGESVEAGGFALAQEAVSGSGTLHISLQPRDVAVVEGGSAALEVQLGGGREGGAPVYRWYRKRGDGNEEALVDGGSLSGVLTARLQVSAAVPGDAGL